MFQNPPNPTPPDFHLILDKAIEFSFLAAPVKTKPKRVSISISWKPPSNPYYCLNTDESANLNPGTGR